MSGAVTSLFLDSAAGFAGRRYVLLHQSGTASRGAIVYLHPLAEEMNRSRRMVALQARRLAAQGWHVLQIDLAGCGDSEGDFADATWQTWLQDAQAAWHWLAQHSGHTPWLWGLRTGALLACETARRLPTLPSLLLWQPTLDGAQALRQFVRMAGTAGGRPMPTDQPLHIAGYALAPDLTQGMAASRCSPPAVAQGTTAPQLVWLDLSTDARPWPAHAAAAPDWRAAGWTLLHRTLAGPLFWAAAETEVAPALMDATDAALAAQPAAHQAQPREVMALPQQVGSFTETSLSFPCEGQRLQGIVTAAVAPSDLGLLIVVGGPQVRCGAHRMFTQLARHVAGQGHTALRFDLRGMGDSEGEPRPFDDRNADLTAGVTALRQIAPHVQRVLLWGLCDGASAALLFADSAQIGHVDGLCLVNPWARNATSLAQTRLTHHYRARLLSPSFWWRAVRGRVSPRAVGGWVRAGWQARRQAPLPGTHFTTRMATALGHLGPSTHLITAGADETAQEFLTFLQTCAPAAMAAIGHSSLPDADHTFSKPGQLAWLCTATSAWMQSLHPTATGRDAGPSITPP